MFTVAARHRHRKMQFIHLFVNLSSTKSYSAQNRAQNPIWILFRSSV